MKAPLSMVVVNVPEPCPRRWGGLDGNERVRFCNDCCKSVHNLSAMTAPEAGAFVAANPLACVAFGRDDSGNVITLEYAPRAKPSLRRWWWLGAGVVASLAGAVAQLVFGARPAPRGPTVVAGMMRPPPQVSVAGKLSPGAEVSNVAEPAESRSCDAKN